MPNEWFYMPILKWKQGEQIALRNLTPEQWKGITPLIELQPIDAAPDTKSIKTKLPAYLTKVIEQITKSIPANYSVCIDTSYLSPGYSRQTSLMVAVCGFIQKSLSKIVIPVFHATELESLELLSATQIEILTSQPKIILRLRTDQIESSQVGASVEALESIGIKKANIHLLIDQYSLVDRNPTVCFGAVKPYLDHAIGANCGSVTVGGGSFPVNLMGIKQGVIDITRVEWKVWELLQDSGNYPGLGYADYAVTNPAPLPDLDPTTMNPSIAIRYAANGFWRLFKGRGFKSGVPGEYRNLCTLLITDKVFSGEDFSYGDSLYKKASSGGDKNGNPSSWRKEATNHHIVLTAKSL